VIGGPSIACSTATAVKWCKEFEELVAQSAGDCSGRAVNVHNQAYDDAVAVATGATTKANLSAALDKETSGTTTTTTAAGGGKRKAQADDGSTEDISKRSKN
jgi:hypothetical protein